MSKDPESTPKVAARQPLKPGQGGAGKSEAPTVVNSANDPGAKDASPASTTQPVTQSAAGSADSSTKSEAEKPTEKPTEKPAQESAKKTAQKSAQKKAQKKVQKKAQKTTQKPVRKTRKTRAEKAAEAAAAPTSILRLNYIEPWSVTRMAFVISVALMIVSVVAVTVAWFVLQVTGVWGAFNDSITNLLSDDAGSFDINDYVGFSRVVGITLILSALNVIFLTALATICAQLYNLAAKILGGIEVTFAARK